ncbi:MAG: hypothetical protein QOE77_2552 [Blastocatellia bacterium]|nr:hypothetical protein [Blastocatellia bacterium]
MTKDPLRYPGGLAWTKFFKASGVIANLLSSEYDLPIGTASPTYGNERGRPRSAAPTNQLDGLKYKTSPAPVAAKRNPKYNSGLGDVFGGCNHIENSTFTSGAPANTRGIT